MLLLRYKRADRYLHENAALKRNVMFPGLNQGSYYMSLQILEDILDDIGPRIIVQYQTCILI